MRSFLRRCSVSKAIFYLALACISGVSGWHSLNTKAAGPEEPSATPVALKGLDPILLTEGKEEKGKPELAAESDGFRYLFVSAANKLKFEKDRERYAIQFGGHCAMMQAARAQPDLFTVYKGRIYAFGTEGCQKSFLERPEETAVAHRGEEPRRSVVILVFKGMELLDFAGPAEVFAGAGFQVSTVAATRDPVPCFGLVTITPRYTFADCPRSDIIVVPGGGVGEVAKDKRVIDWLMRASPTAEVTLSVCTGAFVLAKAGLLDGKEATTHWGSIERLRKQFPQITVRDDRRVVDIGKIVTSAGVSAGIDGALHLVDRLSGRVEAIKTARYMEYTWQPSAEAKK